MTDSAAKNLMATEPLRMGLHLTMPDGKIVPVGTIEIPLIGVLKTVDKTRAVIEIEPDFQPMRDHLDEVFKMLKTVAADITEGYVLEIEVAREPEG